MTRKLNGSSDSELVARYKKQYQIPDEAEITPEMVYQHWELEKSLTQTLLKTTPENRWEVFDYCYSRLYAELEWLHRLAEKNHVPPPEDEYAKWVDIIGPPPRRVYEIGSGTGRLISYLASLGHECRATEISKERGEKHVTGGGNLTWSATDGIHLNRFENEFYYDIVISKDVIEHMHPDDIRDHFSGVYNILKPGGRYVLYTVHTFFGPHDISRVFNADKPMGMHLKEYAVYELVEALKKTGFRTIRFPYPVFSKRYHDMIPFSANEVLWTAVLEKILVVLPKYARRRLSFNRRIFPIRDIFLVAEKDETATG